MFKSILTITLLFIPFTIFANTTEYVVRPGDSLDDIAEMFEVSTSSLQYEKFQPGEEIVILDQNNISEKEQDDAELKKEILTLENKVALLETENTQLKSRISLMEQIISLLTTIVSLKQ